MAAARFIVSGRVQGVWFRASARAEALRLDLSGYANNLVDGSVEVYAEGRPEALDQLAEWLRHGPPLARVAAVQREAVAEQGRNGFLTG